MQRILASGTAHRRRQCYPLCLPALPDGARPPLTVLSVSVCAQPQWEETDCASHRGLAILVTVPLTVRARDACGRIYSLTTYLREELALRSRGPEAACWRGQVFVQAAVRLAGRAEIGCGSPCEIPLEVFLEGYMLAPCAVNSCGAPACPPPKPWYPQPLFDPYEQR